MKLHSLCRWSNLVRVIRSKRLRWAGHVAEMEEGRSAFKIGTDKATGTRPSGRPRRRWEDSFIWTLKKLVSIPGIGLIRLRIEVIGETL